jgi:hypothetical protein|tara:strand:- start:1156 stop:1470 length:315 start_codon:yes stop_codon:yes gene_type:complete
MFIEEVTEGYVQIWGRSKGKTVRKYRCTSGVRKGRIVAKPTTCSAPINTTSRRTLKLTKAKQGGKMKAKSRITKRTNPASRRLKRLNTGRRRTSKTSSSRRKKI